MKRISVKGRADRHAVGVTINRPYLSLSQLIIRTEKIIRINSSFNRPELDSKQTILSILFHQLFLEGHCLGDLKYG